MVTRKNTFYFDTKGNVNAEAWLNHIAIQRPEGRLRLIRHATALSQLTGTQQKTPLGISCVQQGLVMADFLLDLMLDEDTICAALLYNSVCYAELDLRTIEEQLNSNVTKLLKGALRMNNISHFLELRNLKQNQLEKFRKMLFSMADDMRVVVLKLSERTAWLRAIKQGGMRTAETRVYAREAITIYASLANRLGIHALRYELEDLAMEQLAPRLYQKISGLLKERFIERESYIKEITFAIEITLAKVGIKDCKITSRVKNFYGTYRKMCQKNLSLHEVYDLNAIRIIVNTIQECYQVAQLIQTLWTPVKGSFDDYIQLPKKNNYRSIHLAVYGVKDKIIEIQVRTFEMDQESEHGLAAHWEYKEELPQKPAYHTKIAWLRQVLTWQKELVQKGIYLMPELTATLDDRVYVLTESGDIMDLPKGATALDFAYHVRADMGHYCSKVLVNEISQDLTYMLHTGEQVVVFTDKQLTISWDWLNPDLGYLNTAHAKAQVLHWFQQKDYYQHIITGQLLLEKGCRQLGIQFLDQEKLAHDLSFQSKKELFAALGSGELRIVQALHALQPYSKNQKHYTTFDQPKRLLSTRENLPSYQANHPSLIEMHIIAASKTDILAEILHIIHTNHMICESMQATYKPEEQRTYITLRIHPIDSARLEILMTYLQSIQCIESIIPKTH